MKKLWQLAHDAAVNRLTPPVDVTYITDRSNWAVTSVAHDLVSALNQTGLAAARTTSTAYGTRRTLLHFGSPYTYLLGRGVHRTHPSNKIVLSIFHIPPGNDRIKQLLPIQNKLQAIHVPTSLTQNQLINFGFNSEKIKLIPFGVNLNTYQPAPFKIPNKSFVIGSFQKDGHGWGQGLEPKLVKGPDLLVKALQELRQKIPVFVLLAGPARGYVISHLKTNNIPFRYLGYQADRQTIARAYHALDAYLITSRVEGGPLQLLEAWASGIPVISTKVGMCADLGQNNTNILLADMSAKSIAQAITQLYQNQTLRQQLVKNAATLAQNHAWPLIAHRYYDQLYQA